NIDATLPTERGMAPGNGSMVAALRHATGVEPDVAGKPEPGMFTVAAQDIAARRPLIVGDRLDTDIEGAVRAGMDSLLVLTGVNTVEDALRAEPVRRPTFILPDLAQLAAPFALPVVDGDEARCGAVSATWSGGDITINGPAQDPRVLRAVLALLAAHSAEAAWDGQLIEAGAAAEQVARTSCARSGPMWPLRPPDWPGPAPTPAASSRRGGPAWTTSASPDPPPPCPQVRA